MPRREYWELDLRLKMGRKEDLGLREGDRSTISRGTVRMARSIPTLQAESLRIYALRTLKTRGVAG
jgi:hypothetical protein